MEVAGVLSGAIALLQIGFRWILSEDVKDFGYAFGVALQFLPEARAVVHRVRKHVHSDVDGNAQARSMKESYTPTFAMIGVAGAIIAQIALTALTLPELESAHWTAQASFVICLVSGALSVFFSCVLQSILSGLHTPQQFRDWITEGLDPESKEILDTIDQLKQDPRLESRQDIKEAVLFAGGFLRISRLPRPSLYAALILTSPLQLLRLALAALLVGFGVYFGFNYSARLQSGDGGSALAVLITYIVCVSLGLANFYIPFVGKLITIESDGAMMRVRPLVRQIEEELRQSDIEASAGSQIPRAGDRAEEPDKQTDAVEILNELVRLQNEQLVQQQRLLAIMSERLSPPQRHAGERHTWPQP